MIIRVESANADNVAAGRQSLEVLAETWGHQVADSAGEPWAEVATERRDKVLDPVSLTALVLSISSAALAALDLADRIEKRRRAKNLIDRSRELSTQNVTVSLLSQNQPVELATLSPDELLDLLADDGPTT